MAYSSLLVTLSFAAMHNKRTEALLLALVNDNTAATTTLTLIADNQNIMCNLCCPHHQSISPLDIRQGPTTSNVMSAVTNTYSYLMYSHKCVEQPRVTILVCFIRCPPPRAAPRHPPSQTMRCAWLAVETTQLRTCSASTQQKRTAMTACHDVTCFFADAMR